MKKIIISCLLLCLSILLFSKNKVNAQGNGFDYQANFSKGLPSDWKLYEKCAKSEVTSTNGNGSVTINHSGNGTQAQYYGGVYLINPTELDLVSDFTFEMTFKVNSYLNEDRWIGVMYHANLDGNNNLTGYDMNYRVRGKSAQSTISMNQGTANFQDSLAIEDTGVKLNDGKNHTIKLVCKGTTVTHYIDNKAIVTYEYTDYSSGLSNVQKNGGFALIVNKMSITISSVNITYKEIVEKELDTTLTSTYNPTDNLVGHVGVISKVNSKEDLNKMIVDEVKPTTAIIYVDENMNACSENGKSLGMSIKDVYLGYLYQRIIPAFYIKTEAIADKFIDYYKENISLMDAFVISDNKDIVKNVRENLYYLRGIVDYSKVEVDSSYWKNVVADSNASKANVVILSAKDASYEAIRYIQARFKTVWIDNDNLSKIDVKEQIVNGAYGIVYDDFRFVHDTIYLCQNDNLYMNRIPYNVAHRGTVFTKAENSLEGFIDAYNNGATHIEIDIRLTKDKQIVIMHDESIDRTTTGSGNVAQLTLSQIKQYKIDSYLKGSIENSKDYANIPSLEEVFNEFKDKDVVLVVEIKSYEVELIEELKKLINKYEMADNMVVISFHNSQLVNMKNIIPEVPTSLLINSNEDVFVTTLQTLATLNCGFDGGTWASADTHLRKLALRGYSSWMWTYQREENISVAFKDGVLGITNNEPLELKDYAVRIEFDNDVLIAEDDNYNKIDGTIVKYNKAYNIKDVVWAEEIEEHNGYAYVIYKYRFTTNYNSYETNEARQLTYILFSDKMLVMKQSLKDDIDYANEILKKETNKITKEEVEFLEDFVQISEDLVENKVSDINLHLLNQKYLEAKELLEEKENEVPTPPQTGDNEQGELPPTGDDENQKQPDLDDDKLEQETPEDEEDGDNSIAIIVVIIGVVLVLGLVGFIFKRR